MRISDWSSDVCSSDLLALAGQRQPFLHGGIDLLHGPRQLGLGRLDLAEHSGGRLPAAHLLHGGINARQAGLQLAIGRRPGLVVDGIGQRRRGGGQICRSEEHTSELQSLMRISYAVFCLKKKKQKSITILMYLSTTTQTKTSVS